MKEYSISKKEQFKRIDFTVLFCSIFISSLSVLVLYGGRDKFGSSKYITQLVAMLIGIFIAVALSYIDYDKFISKFEFGIFLTAVLLMVIVVIFGKGENGNNNWINLKILPISIQPSELVKPLFIILIAKQIDRLKKNINRITNILILLIYAGIFIGLVLLTGDLGSALVYIAIFAIMLFAAGVSLWYYLALIFVVILSSPLLWNIMSETQRQRILVGFNPELDSQGYGYQPLLSKKAIAAGGFRGLGLSGGNIYKVLPASHSDFIFSVLAEKFGFIGCFILILLLIILVIRIFFVAKDCRKDYGSGICVGVNSIIIVQSFENIGMCLAMLPVVGITLPFFSYGGSSIVSMYFCIGLIMSIKSHNKKFYFEKEKK